MILDGFYRLILQNKFKIIDNNEINIPKEIYRLLLLPESK